MLVVDVAALQRAGTEIAEARNLLRSTLDDLDADVRPLTETWGGEAQRAYAARRDAWRRAAEELTAVLGEIGRAVDDSASDYLTTETRNRALFD
ncbi:WXG100 family type VII secretion target [Catenuloplanes japonicus]|uniref:WXG100 family type VII secretion target n=1 Tax=Catenuloplanes japonicus TaxID=33876 RepID=UPI000527F175|nr:WXG100 family type VII secretion target [Catenuloplanes japonicus]